MYDLDALFAMPDKELFDLARNRSSSQEMFRASPILFDTLCLTDPPCRHCKWESFKAQGRMREARMSPEQAVERAKYLESCGINRAFFATGWLGYKVPEALMESVAAVRSETSLELYALIGAVDAWSLQGLKRAGLDGYLCGLESPNETVYRSYRTAGDSLQDRLDALGFAKEAGLKIWSGFLIGFGETEADCRRGLEMLQPFHPESLSILPFMPHPDTPMYREAPPAPYKQARIMAIGNLFLEPEHVFMDQEGTFGMYGQLAGANSIYAHPDQKKGGKP